MSHVKRRCDWLQPASSSALPAQPPALLLSGLVYEITPWDVTAYVATIAVLGGAALLAILVPGSGPPRFRR